jgi:ABC-type transport system involved in cytochrome c biogenesis permease subunit
MESLQLVSLADVFALIGAGAALLSGVLHFRALRRRAGPEAGRNPASWLALAGVLATSLVMALWIRQRWIEVNHFPSQTMSEVVTMFSAALVFSLIALHFALGLFRRGPGWAILDDALIALTLLGVFFVHRYMLGLTTSERDLPPALQSYWFAPHLSSLIYSYATLGIAGLICLVWFCTRFWGGVFVGGRSARSQILVLGVLLLVPFLQVVAVPVLALTGLVFGVLKLTGRLPGREAFAGLERELDDVSFRAFAVGIPFLTAGLWMGAFWAQEAWANYWGWDSKENSALITWLVYVVYIHLRMLGGYRGEKSMAMLLGGALSIFATFQLFGYMPDSQKNSMHKYTDDNVVPREGMQGGAQTSASAPDDSEASESSR